MGRALAGESAAIDALVDRLRCVPRMLADRNRRMGSPLDEGDLLDVAQETAAAVWRKLPDYAGRAALETWVYRFAYLELMLRLRRRRRRPGSLEDVQAEPQAAAEPAAFEYEELHRCLDELPDDEAEIVRLKHYDDLTFEEVGALRSISPNTAKTRYYRGILKLRARLATQPGRVPEE